MNKEDISILLSEPLQELDEFAEDIQHSKILLNHVLQNFDILKDNVSDEEIAQITTNIIFHLISLFFINLYKVI